MPEHLSLKQVPFQFQTRCLQDEGCFLWAEIAAEIGVSEEQMLDGTLVYFDYKVNQSLLFNFGESKRCTKTISRAFGLRELPASSDPRFRLQTPKGPF